MSIAALVGLMLTLALIGVLAWAITTFIPMPPNIKMLIIVVCGIVCVLYALSFFGLLTGPNAIRTVH